MPLANRIYSPGNRRPVNPNNPVQVSTNRSPIGGCWIEDIYFPFNWWLPPGTMNYYIAWVLNRDGYPINYTPVQYDESFR
jgi:hypothetical protein